MYLEIGCKIKTIIADCCYLACFNNGLTIISNLVSESFVDPALWKRFFYFNLKKTEIQLDKPTNKLYGLTQRINEIAIFCMCEPWSSPIAICLKFV